MLISLNVLILKKMKMECSASTEQEMHDEEFVKAMASGWKKSVKNGFVKGVLATLILCLCLVGGYWGLTRWILTSVPSANTVSYTHLTLPTIA